MKVLFVNGSGERAGAERVFLHLLKYLDRGRFEPVVAFLAAGPFVSEVGSLGVRTIQLPPAGRLRHLRRWTPTIDAIRVAICQTGAHLVHANGEKVSVWAGRAARAEGVPCISWLQDSPGGAGAASWLTQLALRSTRCDRVVVCAQWMADEFNRRIGLGAMAIVSGCDTEELPGPNDSVMTLKREMGWPEDAPVLGHFARLQRWKGTETFLKAAALLRDRHPEAKFLVVGGALFGRETEFAAGLRELARRLDLDSHLLFTGFRSDALALMAECDIVVHCSTKPDPFPTVVLEGMALGKAVIATRSRGPEEALTHEVTGVLVTPGAPDELAAAMSRLLDSPELRRRLGDAASREVRSRLSAKRMTQEFEALYEELTLGATKAAT